MREFPTNETTRIRLKATMCSIFSASWLIRLERQLLKFDPTFAVVFMLSYWFFDRSVLLSLLLTKHLLFFVLYIILLLTTFRRHYILIVGRWQQTETNYYGFSDWIANLQSINGPISKMLNEFSWNDAFIYLLIYVGLHYLRSPRRSTLF